MPKPSAAAGRSLAGETMQLVSKDPARFLNLPVCGLGDLGEPEESMDHRRCDAEFGTHAGLLEPMREFATLIEQRVVRGEVDERGREAGEIRGAHRAGIPVFPGWKIGAVVIPEPRHRLTFEQESLRKLEHAWSVEISIGHRVDQKLKRDSTRAGISIIDRRDGGQIPPGTVSANRQSRWITTEFLGVGGRPSHRGDRIFDGGGIRRFGGQAVVDRNDQALGVDRDPPHRLVRGIQIAEHPSAPVEENEGRKNGPRVWVIEPNWNVAARPGKGPIKNACHGATRLMGIKKST